MLSSSSSKACLAAAAVLLSGFAFLSPADATQPGIQQPAVAAPVYLQTASLSVQLVPFVAPSPLLGLGSSVMPPGPAPGQVCTTTTGGGCSAFVANERCSAFNSNGNQCSTFGPDPVIACSAYKRNSACSVLPPSSGGNPSQCSTFGATQNSHRCSSIGMAYKIQCSAKGSGSSQCSTFPMGAGSSCSVFNAGSTQRSFCSTKFNQPTIAKGCSTFDDFSACSIVAGGKGICTTFGAANPASCSAFTASSNCSVIGGPNGNPCVQ